MKVPVYRVKNFDCSNNKLSNLIGSPYKVEHIKIINNPLKNRKGEPIIKPEILKLGIEQIKEKYLSDEDYYNLYSYNILKKIFKLWNGNKSTVEILHGILAFFIRKINKDDEIAREEDYGGETSPFVDEFFYYTDLLSSKQVAKKYKQFFMDVTDIFDKEYQQILTIDYKGDILFWQQGDEMEIEYLSITDFQEKFEEYFEEEE